MSVDQWNNRHQWLNQDTVAALSEEERQLFDDIQITLLSGKGNHLVPCLIPRDCVHAMDLLCSPDVRRAVHVADNNKHIFANRGESTHHVGHATRYAMKKAHVDSSISNATNQRGHVSTLYASFDVAEQDRA